MTATDSLLTIVVESRALTDCCERIVARGNIQSWEASAIRTRAEQVLCAAHELSLRLASVPPPKNDSPAIPV